MATMTATYATVDGVLFGEHRGGVITRYVPDTLGSVVQSLDDFGDQSSYTEFRPVWRNSESNWNEPKPVGSLLLAT